MTEEEWKDIPSWQGLYQASSFGNIRSLENSRQICHRGVVYTRTYGGKQLSPKRGRGGYLYVNLWKNNCGHMRAVHRLVCEAFNPHKNSSFLVVNHKDGNPQNNFFTNLEFITQKENLLDAAKRNGRPSWEIACERKASWRKALSAP